MVVWRVTKAAGFWDCCSEEWLSLLHLSLHCWSLLSSNSAETDWEEQLGHSYVFPPIDANQSLQGEATGQQCQENLFPLHQMWTLQFPLIWLFSFLLAIFDAFASCKIAFPSDHTFYSTVLLWLQEVFPQIQGTNSLRTETMRTCPTITVITWNSKAKFSSKYNDILWLWSSKHDFGIFCKNLL